VLKNLFFILITLSATPLLGAGESSSSRNDSAGDIARQRFAEHALKHSAELSKPKSSVKLYEPLLPPTVSMAESLPAPKPVPVQHTAQLPPVVSMPVRLDRPVTAQVTPPKSKQRSETTAKLEQFDKPASQGQALIEDGELPIFQNAQTERDEKPLVIVKEEVEAQTPLFAKTQTETSPSYEESAKTPATITGALDADRTTQDSDLAAPPELLTATLTTVSKRVLQWLFVLFVLLPIAIKYNPVFFYRLFTKAPPSEESPDLESMTAAEGDSDENVDEHADLAKALDVLDEPNDSIKSPQPFVALENIDDIHAELSSTLHDVDQYLSGVDTATGIALATKSKTQTKTDQQTGTERLLDSQQLQMQTTEFRLIANSAAHKAIKRHSDKQRITFRMLRGVAACMAAIGLGVFAWSAPGMYGLALGASCIAVSIIAVREYRAWQVLREQE